MALTNEQITAKNFKEFYDRIYPYLSGGSGGSGGHTIKDDSTDMTQRAGLNFIDHDISDDSTDDETDIAPHELTQAELEEIMNIKPSASAVTVDVVNRFTKSDIYSETERIVGQWIDGKPIYQKTFSVTVDDVDIDYMHNISNIDNFVDYSAFWNKGNGGYEPLPYCSKWDSTRSSGIYFSTVKIEIRLGAGLTATGTIYISIKYTKTTDSAVSIGTSYDYTNTEKVVGSWITGKPVYQKTFSITVDSLDIDYTHNISNIDDIVDCNVIWKTGTGAGKPLSYISKYTSNHSCGFTISPTIFEIRLGSGLTATGTIYVSIQYTKTTD